MNMSASIEIVQYDSLNDKQLKQIKYLIRSAISTSNHIENKTVDMIAIAHFGSSNKIVGIGCISPESPKRHFANESDVNARVAYLHNFICDPKYRKHKISVQLIDAIKSYVSSSTLYTCADINANIVSDQQKPIKFFTRNGFVKVGVVGKNMPFDCYTYQFKK